jgi:Arc/MetJ-type ribon-helix-helix transcriptional regulator
MWLPEGGSYSDVMRSSIRSFNGLEMEEHRVPSETDEVDDEAASPVA